MPVAILVIDCNSALQKRPQRSGIERRAQLGIVQRFGLVEQEPSIPIGRGDQRFARCRGQRQRPFQRFGPHQQLVQRRRIEPPQDQHLRSGEQRGVQREAGVFRGRADQRDRALFHERQEPVLLGAVEAVDLVHEQQRALAHLGCGFRFGEGLLEIGDTREHRADRHEPHPHGGGEQPRDGGLAGARRSPQDHAGKLARRDHSPDRPFGSGQVFLPDHVSQDARSQPVSQRRIFARLL